MFVCMGNVVIGVNYRSSTGTQPVSSVLFCYPTATLPQRVRITLSVFGMSTLDNASEFSRGTPIASVMFLSSSMFDHMIHTYHTLYAICRKVR